MIKLFIITIILISGCGKKGKLFIDEKGSKRESIIKQDRTYKFFK